MNEKKGYVKKVRRIKKIYILILRKFINFEKPKKLSVLIFYAKKIIYKEKW